ncbi:MAG TPA: cytochrome c [Thiobacillus sp.]
MLALITAAHAQQPATANADIHLSPPLRGLLQEEMREVARGTQPLAIALASGDWNTLADTSAKIRASYILEKKLSAAQKRELEHALPAGFKQLDAEFHARAEKLAHAAGARDPELAAFHFSRMVESCIACHSAYAKARFPGFSSTKPAADHRH